MSRSADFPLLVVGALALALAVPSDRLPEGLGFLGWLALVPVFILTFRHGTRASSLAGLLFHSTFLLVSTFWLWGFHPLAFPIVLVFTTPLYAAVFALSSWLWKVLPRSGAWAQAALWTIFEWARNLGWLAFPYGALASTQAFAPITFQTADVVGTSGLTFVMALVAALAAKSLTGARLARPEIPAAIVLLGLHFGYGAFQLAQPVPVRTAIDGLSALSSKALDSAPDAIIWPETAVVPSVHWHTRYRTDAAIWRVLVGLEQFLVTSPVPVLVGNDHGVLAADGKTRLDYNAVLLWDNGWQATTTKNRLVPFTESFPDVGELSFVREWLEASGSRFWEAGAEQTLFDLKGLTAGVLICFEDAFGGSARNLALQGARVLINVTNDSWSPGTAARDQHLALAVFRAAETRLPLVRAGNDGRTAVVSDRGVVTSWLSVGSPGFLVADVAVPDREPSVYSRFGDVFPLFLAVFLAFDVVWGLSRIRLTRVSSCRKIMPLE